MLKQTILLDSLSTLISKKKIDFKVHFVSYIKPRDTFPYLLPPLSCSSFSERESAGAKQKNMQIKLAVNQFSSYSARPRPLHSL
jgi:hypothetical protein